MSQVDWDYQVGDKVLARKEGILPKSECCTMVSLKLSPESIQMEQSGFRVEISQMDSTFGE